MLKSAFGIGISTDLTTASAHCFALAFSESTTDATFGAIPLGVATIGTPAAFASATLNPNPSTVLIETKQLETASQSASVSTCPTSRTLLGTCFGFNGPSPAMIKSQSLGKCSAISIASSGRFSSLNLWPNKTTFLFATLRRIAFSCEVGFFAILLLIVRGAKWDKRQWKQWLRVMSYERSFERGLSFMVFHAIPEDAFFDDFAVILAHVFFALVPFC